MRAFIWLCGATLLGVMGCQEPPATPPVTPPLDENPLKYPACPQDPQTGAYKAPLETCTSMNDFRTRCSSCELLQPCFIPSGPAKGTVYTWYSPRICDLCGASCAVGTDVGNFCTAAYGGRCWLQENGNYVCGYSKLPYSNLQFANFPGKYNFYFEGYQLTSFPRIQGRQETVFPVSDPSMFPPECPNP